METINIGTVANKLIAESTIKALEGYGFSPKEISFAVRVVSNNEKDQINEMEGLSIKSLRIGAVTIPGAGSLIVGGPIAMALGVSTANGLMMGKLEGTLVGLGISKKVAKIYKEILMEGGVVLAVPQNSRTDGVKSKVILEQLGVDKIESIEVEDNQRLI